MFERIANALGFYDRLTNLHNDLMHWSQETFGTDVQRGPIGPLKHLAKEALEAVEAEGSEALKVELADCLLCLMDATRRSGFKFDHIIRAAIDKMQINKSRKWPKVTGIDSDEPIEHVRE